LALQGKFLILDEGAGPSIRRLLVVELAEGGEVWSGRYAPEPKPSLSARGLIFYKYLRIAGKKRLPQGAEDHFKGVNAAVCDQWSAFSSRSCLQGDWTARLHRRTMRGKRRGHAI